MARAWTGLGIVVVAAGCGGETTAQPAESAPVATKETRTPTAVPPALAEARRQLAAAKAMSPPRVPALATHAETVAFVQAEVRPWVARKGEAMKRAAAAYANALSQLSDDDIADAALELGDLWNSFANEVIEISVASGAPQLKTDALLANVFRRSLEETESMSLLRSKARAAYELCLERGKGHGGAAEACQQRLASMQAPVAAAPEPNESPSSRPRSVALPERPWLPTRQPVPCTFAGSIRLSRVPLSSSEGGSPVALLSVAEVEKLELPAQRSAPLRVTTSWPVKASFYVGAEHLPLKLRSRVQLVPEHVWLAAGSAVSAAKASSGNALVSRRSSGAIPDNAKIVRCSELELANVAPSRGNQASRRENFVGEIALHAAPQGKRVASFSLEHPESLEVIAERDGWRHVAGRRSPELSLAPALPYDFDGWISARPTSEGSFGMIGILTETAAPTHVTSAELELFANSASTTRFATLAKDVPVLVGETRDGVVNIDVPGLMPTGSAWGFWVRADAFERSGRKP